MNGYQNITISIPKSLVKLLSSLVQKGQRSEFIAEAVEEKLIEKKMAEKYDIVEETKKIQSQFGGTMKSSEIKSLIERGRKW